MRGLSDNEVTLLKRAATPPDCRVPASLNSGAWPEIHDLVAQGLVGHGAVGQFTPTWATARGLRALRIHAAMKAVG